MEVDEVVNSCRVCRTANQDGDFECLYMVQVVEQHGVVQSGTWQLTEAGRLYEEMLDIEIEASTMEVYPQYLCNCCDLQMRLFRKLTLKARRTLEALAKLNATRVSSESKQRAVEVATASNAEPHNVEALTADDEFTEEQQYLESATKQLELEGVREKLEVDEAIVDEVLQLEQPQPQRHKTAPATPTSDAANSELHALAEDSDASNIYMYEALEEADIGVTTKATTTTIATQIMRSDSASTNTDTNVQDPKEIEFISLCEESNMKAELLMLGENGEYFDVHYLEECDENSIAGTTAAASTRTAAQNSLKSTIKRTGSKRTYECHACTLEFLKRADFLKHRKLVHSSKFPCPECPRLLNTSDALRVHLQLHRGEPAYKCDLCQRTFNQKVHYNYHMDRHNNVRNFKCTQCQKGFLSKADLSVHMRSHTGERPYECEICGKSYLILQHLKMHRYSHFGKSFECKTCNQKFISPSTLRTHIKTIHNSEARFQCEFCVKRFKRKHHLIAHYKVHQHPKTLDNTTADELVANDYQLVNDQLTEDCSNSVDAFMKISDAAQMDSILVVDDDDDDAVAAATEAHALYGDENAIDIEEDVSVF